MRKFTNVTRRVALLMLSMFFSFAVVMAQERTVSGTVTAEDEGPIPGVNIFIQGTTVGTISDLDGSYKLTVPGPDAILIFSSVGYKTQSITVGNQSVIDVVLEADVTALQEVVVTGYTAQSKRDITGAITSVDTELLQEMPAASFTQQLQGRAAGVTIGQDNRPGSAPLVRIRGWGTINDNNPLYVIDGVPTKSDIQAINPNNIESIQILKDASAASIYGSRAANGVIVITTKKGKSGAPQITFDARVGVQRAANKLDLANTQQLGELLYTAARNDYIDVNGSDAGFEFSHGQYGPDPNASGFIPDYIFPSGAMEGDPSTDPSLYSLDPYYGITRANKSGTDWYDEIFKPALLQEYNIGISGGSDKGRYFIALNYFDQDGIVYATNYERYSIRANSEFSAKEWLRIGETMEVSYSERVTFGTPNQEGNGIALIYRTQPIIPLKDINGYYAGTRGSSLGNADTPFASLDRNKDNIQKRWRVFGGAYLEVDLFEGLTFKTQLGIDYRNYFYSGFSPRNIEGAEPSTNDALGVDYNYNFDWTWYNTLTYTKTFGSAHRINVLVGTEAIENLYRDLGADRVGFFSLDENYRFLNAGSAGITNYGGGSESSLFSIFGKVNYVLMDKYLFEATIRRDGSSRFSASNRYATFPAFSVGWRLSEEPFLSGVGWITDLKLRGGWGQMGNQEIRNYNEFSTFRSAIEASGYDIAGSNSSVVPGFDSNYFGNPNGKWETTTTLDIGFDWTIANKFTINFDWYDRTTTDMLYILTLPGTQGSADAPYQNVGEMNNKGIDLNLVWNSASASGDFQYEIGLNLSHYKNEIVKLSDNAAEGFYGESRRQAFYTRNEAGVPWSSFYGYYIDGFTDGTESETLFPSYYNYLDGRGRFKYRDVNNDGVISDADRDFIGSPHPDFTYGLNFNASYKNFDFVVFFQGSQGNDLINYVRRWTDFWFFQGNRSVKMYEESWTPERGDAASLPILSANDNVSGDYPSTYFVENGSYMRLKNLQIGYTFPNLKGLNRLRVYAQATNLFTITSYSGLDPEVNINGDDDSNPGDANLGFDEGYYPTAQQFMFGVNLGF